MATALHFTKGHGTGNDFVLYSDPEGERPLSPGQIASLCDRHFGIGADGVIRAVKSKNLNTLRSDGAFITDPAGAAALAEDPAAEWFMDYYNADGSLSEMCGNGIRVYAKYLLESGLAVINPGDTMAIGTRGGVRDLRSIWGAGASMAANLSCASRVSPCSGRALASTWATRTWSSLCRMTLSSMERI